MVRAQWRTLKTNLVKTTGRAPVGTRLIDHAPFGHWNTQTPDQVRGRLFIAGLAQDGLIAPWVLDGAMNRASFDADVEHQRAPALKPGQILAARPRTGGSSRLTHDNLSSHKSPRAIALLRAQGNDLIFLPPYSPDPCVAKNSPPDCFLYAPHPSRWHSQS